MLHNREAAEDLRWWLVRAVVVLHALVAESQRLDQPLHSVLERFDQGHGAPGFQPLGRRLSAHEARMNFRTPPAYSHGNKLRCTGKIPRDGSRSSPWTRHLVSQALTPIDKVFHQPDRRGTPRGVW